MRPCSKDALEVLTMYMCGCSSTLHGTQGDSPPLTIVHVHKVHLQLIPLGRAANTDSLDHLTFILQQRVPRRTQTQSEGREGSEARKGSRGVHETQYVLSALTRRSHLLEKLT